MKYQFYQILINCGFIPKENINLINRIYFTYVLFIFLEFPFIDKSKYSIYSTNVGLVKV